MNANNKTDMASNASKIAPPSGIRTPSPTKSRLPIGGSTLPQRTASVKGLSNISLQPSTRRPSTRGLDTTAKQATLTSKLSRNYVQNEVHSTSKPVNDVQPNASLGRSLRLIPSSVQQNNSPSPSKTSASTASQDLTYSRETLDYRLELLHLHTVHKAASVRHSEWEQSAYDKCKRRFEALQNQSQELREIENDALTQTNAKALLSWSSPDTWLEKQFQILSGVVSEIEALTSKDGRYTLVIEAFEHWSDSTQVPSRNTCVEGLGDGWLAEIEYLQARLVDCADSMLSLPELIEGESNLGRIITVTSEMLKNMLEELDMVSTLEGTISQEEKERSEGSITDITNRLGRDLALT